ncbi:hypothetical protein RR46_04030 [Papilio xuthus]|uniref:Uncharacterized protein n=1 Tax=Papilio xuthus TaxID=66420 RepID=A0A194QI09_PAPXU|nr:hypothetical protein RR46_04030 [Papilio xuthus]
MLAEGGGTSLHARCMLVACLSPFFYFSHVRVLSTSVTDTQGNPATSLHTGQDDVPSTGIKSQKDGLHEAPIYIYNLQIQIFSLTLAVCSVLRHHRRRSSAGVTRPDFQTSPAAPRALTPRPSVALQHSARRHINHISLFCISFILITIISNQPAFHYNIQSTRSTLVESSFFIEEGANDQPIV